MMSYSCLEELQVDLDLHTLDKTNILSKVGCQCNNGWFVVTDDGICHLFDKDGNLDDIKKITQLKEKHIRKDITKIVIPDSVTSIGSYVFYYCSGLKSVTIPGNVMEIGYRAFSHCSGLVSVTILNGVTSIGYRAFSCCEELTNVTIPNTVTSIGDEAFEYCSRLTSVTIPDSVTSIGSWAFYNCNGLINLTFKGKTLKQVKKMKDYSWGIEDESIIKVE